MRGPCLWKKEAEPADKPGSVVDSHSSRRYVTATLKQPTRIQRGPRQRIPIWSCSRWGLPCRSVARLAVRSYRTISPLPAFRRRRRRYLSVALSVGLRRPGVTWHLALWSPDFPRHPRRDDATVWPAPPAHILAYARPSCRADRGIRFIHAWRGSSGPSPSPSPPPATPAPHLRSIPAPAVANRPIQCGERARPRDRQARGLSTLGRHRRRSSLGYPPRPAPHPLAQAGAMGRTLVRLGFDHGRAPI